MSRKLDGSETGSHPPQRETTPSLRAVEALSLVEIVVEREAGQVAERRWQSTDKSRVRIGAHPSCDLVLDDPSVSRIHCELRASGGSWQLLDLGSRNGTSLDGVRVRDADLPARDARIELGGSVLRVRVEPPQPEASTMGRLAFGRLYGASAPMQKLFTRIERIAATDTDVLIEGESGTGKELVAAEIVQRSKRAKKPFVIVDGGALSPTVVESELFGHAKGAFTGADRDRAGAFEIADGGTVFLDEIGELPLALQPKLLRVLAAREVRRLGETQARKIDVRVIAATNRRLETEVNQGRFREDLFFRLSVIRVEVPSLRERLDDLPLLIGSFLEQLQAPELLARFTPELYTDLRAHSWPGNVRELRNWVERFAVLEERELPRPSVPVPAGGEGIAIDYGRSYGEAKTQIVHEFERRYLKHLLDAAGGNVSKAARAARMDRMHFHRLLQRHELRRDGTLDD